MTTKTLLGLLLLGLICLSCTPTSVPTTALTTAQLDSLKIVLDTFYQHGLDTKDFGPLEAQIEQWEALADAGFDSPLAYASYLRGRKATLEESIGWYEKSLGYYLKAKPEHDSLTLRVYANLADCYFIHHQQFDRSLHYAQEGLAYANARQDTGRLRYHNLRHQMNLNAGRSLQQMGDPQSAIDHYELANSLEVEAYRHSQCANEYAMALKDLQRYPEAIAKSQAAIDIHLQGGDPVDSLFDLDQHDLADVYNNRYLIFGELAQADSALSALQKSLAINQRHKEDREYELAQNQHNLGFYYWQQEEYAAAEQAYRRSIAYNQEKDYNYELALNYDNMADLQRDIGQPDSALWYYNASIARFAKLTRPLEQISEATYKEDICTPLASRSLLLAQLNEQAPEQYPFALVRQSFVALDELLLALRLDIRPEASRLLQTNKVRSVLDEGLAFCHRAYLPSQNERYLELAFRLLERSKNTSALEQRSQNKVYRAQLPQPTYDSLQVLDGRLTFLRQQTNNLQLSKKQRETYIQQAREGQVALNYFEEEIKRRYPGFGRLVQQQQLISLDQAQALLAPDERILHFAVADRQVYRMHIEAQAVTFDTLPIARAALASMVDTFRRQLTATASPQASRSRQLLDSGERLYRVLFADIKLPNQLSTLYLVADNFLSLLPFDALCTGATERLDPKAYPDHPYLLKRVNIRHLFSVAAMAQTGQGANQSSGTLALIPQQQKVLTLDQGGKQLQLAPLPIKEERRALQEHFKDLRVLESLEADELESLRLQLSQYRILHFASHGWANPQAPEKSFLLLANGAGEGFPVYADFWGSLSLDAWLTVLSACETGHGQIVEGEGIRSLARLLLLAGSEAVIASRWLANNELKADFFDHFYRLLTDEKESHTQAQALHQAKQKMLEQYYGPEVWANFFLLGGRSGEAVSLN